MIQVQLDADIEARLRAQARARGIETNTYAKALIEGAVRSTPIAARRSARGRKIEDLFEALSRNAADSPELPEEAFIRAGFHDDHN